MQEQVKQSIALVTELIEPTVEALGLELWGIEHLQQGKSTLLRIFIDAEAGIVIEDCERVSRQVSAIFDVEDPIAGEYTLEVSSPGLDRPLFKLDQFERFVGEQVTLRTRTPVDGRRKFKGKIEKVDADTICLNVDGAEFQLDHSDIEKANLVFEE